MFTTLQQPGNLKPHAFNRLRTVMWVLFAAALLTFATLFLRGYFNLKTQTTSRLEKLEHMLTDIKSLSPGSSSFGDAMRIAQKNNATAPKSCSGEECTLEMHVTWSDDSGFATNFLGHHLLSQLGIHIWESRGWIVIEKGIVTSYGAQIAVEDPDVGRRWHEATWTLSQEIPKIDEHEEKQFLHNFDLSRDKSPDFLVDWTNSPHADRLESLDARISIRATDDQRHAAEDFNLKCLTQKGDCSNVCELLPGAARYYTHSPEGDVSAVPYRCN